MTVVEKAQALATAAHEGQRRKDGPAYIVHPTAVAQMLAENGFSEEVVAAAYVHDVLEDTAVPEAKLRAELGDAVVSIVKTVTEDKSLPWEERKQNYIDAVRAGSPEAKAVSVADKIDNLKTLLTLHKKAGSAQTWKLFNRGKEQKLWFEETMLAMLQETWRHPLIDEYALLVEQMRGLE